MKRFLFIMLVRIMVFMVLFGTVMGICYLISRHYDYSYMRIIEYAGMLLLIIGGLSVLGGLSIRSDIRDNETKLSLKWGRGLQEDIKLAADNRVFFVCMALAGLILIVAPLIFNIR
ncbi:hypothetical protein R2R35_17160 [Anaerocolumna sp. AGMB13020]|uniref:hypothetical protein n=1 Tax=Anaerocolumna sp. AGMB13020 TaxID=3081750 RepID=UPI0029541AA2|nr:hypothetical protein [Anaerocolumna sp. AGMB13020]WOO35514.1 hypothetical protein R2R35_17160 [Anaerocolumna sp. AGMB13020]